MRLAELQKIIEQNPNIDQAYLTALKNFADSLNAKVTKDGKPAGNPDEFIPFEQFKEFMEKSNVALDLSPAYLFQDNPTSKFFFRSLGTSRRK